MKVSSVDCRVAFGTDPTVSAGQESGLSRVAVAGVTAEAAVARLPVKLSASEGLTWGFPGGSVLAWRWLVAEALVPPTSLLPQVLSVVSASSRGDALGE